MVGRRPLELWWSLDLGAWAGTFVFFVVGDLITTGVGLAIFDLSEAGPVSSLLVERFGLLVIVPVKFLVVGGCYLVWRTLPSPYCAGVPVGLTTLGATATVWNLHLLVPVALG